jgi:Uma2 family endonuclease
MSVPIRQIEHTPPFGEFEHDDTIPPLKQGDLLSRDEFERRYDAMPHLKKAELIEGVVQVPSPVRQRDRSGPHFKLGGWLFLYRARTPGVEGSYDASVRLDMGSMPQPDCLLFISPAHGGRVTIDEDGYVNGAPDLVGEIAASSASYDLHEKLQAYQTNGVREYLVWRVLDQQIDWFVLRDGVFQRLSAEEDGILRSTIFPGLWLDPAALLSDRFETLIEVLQKGLDTPEHDAFKVQPRQAETRTES